MLKLKLQYFGHLIGRTDSSEKTLMLGKIEGGWERDDRGWDDWMASRAQWTWVWVNSRSWWWTGKPGMLQSMGSQRVGHNWATEQNWLSDWAHTHSYFSYNLFTLIFTGFTRNYNVYLNHLRGLTILLHACMLIRFSHVWFFATLWAIPCRTPLSKGFSRQEH